MAKNNGYELQVETLIERMEADNLAPWHMPWSVNAGVPSNLVSGKPYRGSNAFIAAIVGMSRGYTSPYWLTFKQARDLGGKVRKGENAANKRGGIPIVFFKLMENEGHTVAKPNVVPLVRYSRVFNIEQCEGIDHARLREIREVRAEVEPLAAAGQMLGDYHNAPSISEGGGRAFYQPSTDHVRIPAASHHNTPADHFCVLAHELAHSTGHRTRLNREGVTNVGAFGDHMYATEELVAEFSAVLLAHRYAVNLSPVRVDNSAAYLKGWAAKLRKDPRILYQAASKAQKAVEHIAGTVVEQAEPIAA